MSTATSDASATPSSPPELPLLTDLSHCSPPVRKIFTDEDIPAWLSSKAYSYIETLIQRLSIAVEEKKVEDACLESPVVTALVSFLKKMAEWVDDVPLQTSPQRFGNKAFRDWIAVMEENEEDFQKEILAEEQYPILPELCHHFRTSFGSAARLDYGTGHELSFLAYLLVLRLVGVLTPTDEQAMVTRVFVAYLDVVRKLQKVFKLEPAGSKGVWGLDDHQHLVYLWGASQLRTHPTLRPASILSPPSISPHGISYLFLSSILHINDLKSGPFAEHSPMLHNIASTVPNWDKVNTGLMKMYREEVLKKVPVVQHFWFGGILAWRDARTGEPLPSTGDGVELPEEEVKEEVFLRVRDEGTVAPWALPSLSGITPPSDSPALSPSASALSTSSLSGLRQGSAPSPAPATTVPQPFVPPAIFPKMTRRASRLSISESSVPTVGDEGGASAGSSPFGVLQSATAGRKEGLPWKEGEEM